MTEFIVRGERVAAPADLRVRTFCAKEVPRFRARGVRRAATELIIHETVTRSVNATVRVLRRRALSVHLIIGPDGEITQHGDLASDVLWHAGPVHNSTSIGVEVVNPYSPANLRAGLPWERVIEAPWAHKGKYVLPTPAQAEATCGLIRWATSNPAPGIAVPRR